ncbi:hypothetical protein B0I72DRAFT_133885 [Yarrowia lipolytica]|uniref:Uncharacterized protein n=1 Tax=Yarrowia lipolytica TaxID=4952 RepID=A0A371C2Z8_YARLL|nr:hypothetical protein B0I71DRAFT_134393 [Yarrowia lipolytica]RDW34826.1 hypothetical protein B0I72DRAFT_133885 [Yarrowia lipolytica]RDW40875.1 hypothetical protein B0I73DRAFT_129701 [Yarrowia lipolytica]VBB85865.1 Hypothetical protein conserved in the Yarrowia clade [Yarrowia lipolytica]
MSNYPHQTPLRQTYPDRPTWTAPIGTPKPTTSPRKTPKSVKSIGRLKFSNYAIGEPRRVESRGLGQPSRMLDFGNTRDYAQTFGTTPRQTLGASRDFSQARFGSREPTLTRMTVEEEVEPEPEPERQARDQTRDQTRDQKPQNDTRSTFMSRDYSIPSLSHNLNPGQDSLFAGVARQIESRDGVESRDQIESPQTQPREQTSSRRPMRRNLRSVVVEPVSSVPSVIVTQDNVTEAEEEDTAPPVKSLRETVTRETVPTDLSRDPSSRSRDPSTRRTSRLVSGLESWQAEVSLTQAEGVSFNQMETRDTGKSRDNIRSRDANRSRDPSQSRDTTSRTHTVSVPLNDEEPSDESARARRGTPLPSRDRSRVSLAGVGDRSHDISISRDRGSPGGAPDSALEESFEVDVEGEQEQEQEQEQEREQEREQEPREQSSHEKSFSNINYFTSNREKNKSFEAEEEEDAIESESGESGEVEVEMEARDAPDTQSQVSHDESIRSHETARSGDSTDSSRFKSRYLQDKLSSRDHRTSDRSQLQGATDKSHYESREELNGQARDLLSEHRMADTSLDRIKASAIKKHTKQARGDGESREIDESHDQGMSTVEPAVVSSRDLLGEHRMADTSLDRIKASAIKKHTKQIRESREAEGSQNDRRDSQSREPRLPADLTMPNTSMAQIIEAAKQTHSKSSRDAEKAAQKARDLEEHERKTAEARDRVEREIREKNARDQEKLARIEAARAERLAKRRRTDDEGHVSVSHNRGHMSHEAEKSTMEPPHVTSKLRHVNLAHPKSSVPGFTQDDDDDMSIISELSEVNVHTVGINGTREQSREQQPKSVSHGQQSRDFTSRYGIPEFDESEASAQSKSRDSNRPREASQSRDSDFPQHPRDTTRPRDTSGETTISQHTATSVPASPDSTSRATDLGSPRDHGESRDLGSINTHVIGNSAPQKTHNRQNSILSPFERATKASASSVVATNGKRRFSESRDPAHFESRDIATVNEWRSLDFLITSSLQQQVWSNRFRSPGNAVLRIPPSIRTCFPLVSEARLRDMIVAVVYCRQGRLKERQIAGHRDRRGVSWWKRWF